MSLRLSTKMRNALLDSASYSGIFNGGVLAFFSGSQPADANTVISSSPLVYLYPKGVDPTAPFTVTSILNAGDLVNYTAHGLLDGQPVVFTGGTGAAEVVRGTIYYVFNKTADTFQLSTAISGGSALVITSDSAGGVTCSPAGLIMALTASGGTIAKNSLHTWSGLGLLAGTIGFGRFQGFVNNMATTKSSLVAADTSTYARFDFSVGTSGADLNMSTLIVAVNAVTTVDTFDMTVPTN